MEAKTWQETVMSDDEIAERNNEVAFQSGTSQLDAARAIALAQAKATWDIAKQLTAQEIFEEIEGKYISVEECNACQKNLPIESSPLGQLKAKWGVK